MSRPAAGSVGQSPPMGPQVAPSLPDLPNGEGAPARPPTTQRASTLVSHFLAIERVLRAITEDLSEPITLQTMADIAAVSPYHFNRIFRAITGVPPLRFVSALRIAEAKRLLLTTRLNVTDACFEVGYNSLGSFSSRFKEFVGVSPNQVRRLLDTVIQPHAHSWLHLPAGDNLQSPDAITIGKVVGQPAPPGPILVGLFKDPLPQGRPVACAILTQPGPCALSAPPPDGRYYVFAVALRWSGAPLHYALPSPKQLQVGMGGHPLVITRRQTTRKVEIALRPWRLIDPPLLVDLLTLLQENDHLRFDQQEQPTPEHQAEALPGAGADHEPRLRPRPTPPHPTDRQPVTHPLPRFLQRDRPGAAET